MSRVIDGAWEGPHSEAPRQRAPFLRRIGSLDDTGLPGGQIGAVAEFNGFAYLAARPDPRLGRAASILRADVAGGPWQAVLEGLGGSLAGCGLPASASGPVAATVELGREAVITGLAVLEKSGQTPCLYATVNSPDGARILRSEDGRIFTKVYQATKGRVTCLQHPTPCGDLLVMTGSSKANRAGEPFGDLVVGMPAPRSQRMVPLSPPGFGNAENLGVGPLAVLGGRLFAATTNPARGFQLWSTELSRLGTGKAPAWDQVLRDGAFRYARNPQVTAMAVHGGALHLAAGDDGPGRPGPELLRIEEDGQWEIVAGEARFTPHGLKVPISLLGLGFGDESVRRISLIAGGGALMVEAGGKIRTSVNGENWSIQEDTVHAAIETIVPCSGGFLATAGGILLHLQLPG